MAYLSETSDMPGTIREQASVQLLSVFMSRVARDDHPAESAKEHVHLGREVLSPAEVGDVLPVSLL